MKKKQENNEKSFLLTQEENNTVKKKKKFHLFEHSLLLKQTLVSAWKSKLQLVILLLLTSFATSLITGGWISYGRILEGEKYLQLDDAKFDAVLPYPYSSNITQIANQSFSLKLGRLYYQASESSAPVAVYYDNTIIGQEIKPLSTSDLKIKYTRESNRINGVGDFQWANPNHPINFNLEDDDVKASLYGQLMSKADQTANITLKNNYLNAASDLYNGLVVNFSANQILDSLKNYFTEWIKANPSDPLLSNNDQDFTSFLLANKVNYRGVGEKDLRIPNDVNVAEDIDKPTGILATKLVKKTDPNPRLTPSTSEDYGMNGQWMRIYRNFDLTPKPGPDVFGNFNNSYSSPSNYNLVTDYSDPSVYSYTIANAVAALQSRSVNVVNQFVGTAGIESSTGKSISVKVVNLGLKKIHNSVNMKVFEGIYPSSSSQIAISPQYARSHGIRPGSTITINNKPFIVSAIAGDAYNIYPTINSLDPVPNTRTEFIAYVLPDAFNTGSWFDAKDKTDVSLMYFLPWKNVPISAFDISYFNDYFQKTIFGDNKLSDHYQYDYDQYLIEKYIKNNPDYPSKYQLSQNLVVTESDSQFSAYAKGRLLLNSTLNGFKYAALIGVVFLVGIIIFITYLIVKKAIQKGQVSMGILKSSGYSTWKIIVSYLSYPIMVLLIAIPIGWFVGLAVQVYFTEIFNSLFILPYNVLDFNFIPLLISIVLVCGFVLITTLITGYKMLQKEPLDLIKQNSDISVGNMHKVGWLQAKLENNFKYRFLLSLSKTSWKKIAVTSLVIAIATLAITATVSIPATITNMKDNYFKTQKYKNYYQYQTPIPNMPMSKYGLYAWNNLNNSNKEPYYPVSATMPWPDDVVINDRTTGNKLAWYDPLKYQKTDDTSNFKDIIKFEPSVPQEIRDDITNKIGSELLSLSNGPLTMNFLTWSYSWMGGRAFSNALLKDLSNLDLSNNKNFSTSLITFATTVLPGILNVPNPGVTPGPDAIVEILKQTLPGFIRQILDNKGPNAYDYFSIGHNTVAYNPNYNSDVKGAEEELVTQFQLGSADTNLVKRGFLDVEGINPETKMLVMNSNLINRLKYNSSANIVPMVVNRSFAAKFNLAVGNEFNASPNVKTLYYLNNQNKLVPMPKDSWYYGPNPVNQQPGDFGTKSIWSNSANKWNYRGEKKVDNTDYNDSYGYTYNGVYDKNGNRVLSKEPNSWNNLNEVWLKLPADITGSAKSGTIRTAYADSNLPFNVSNIASSDGNWIKPFSYEVADKYHDKEMDPTNLLLERVPEWYGAMLDKNILVADNNLHLGTLSDDIENNMPLWWKNIVGSTPITKYHIIGIQDSYDTPRAYIDQKWANSILGYSYYNDRSETKDPTYAPGIYQWFSGKLSASDDIYDIIGRMSFKRSADDYTLYSMSNLKGNNEEQMIANSDLLLRKKEMLEKMSDIALSASLLFIITTILCSILIVIMITDAFTDQFRRFMSHMKAEGYTNQEINSFTLGIFTPWVLVGYGVGYGLGFLTVFGFIQVITKVAGLALPFSFIWWIVPLSFAIIAVIYFSTFIINTYQLDKMDLIALLKTDE